MPLGIYISVPFCRTKCTYCNFASDVFPRNAFASYVDRVCADIRHSDRIVLERGVRMDPDVDSIYLGGGTPTMLEASDLERMFEVLRSEFVISADAEITVECAPGTLNTSLITSLLRCGANRVSLGVQSFVDEEAAAIGRKHNRATVLHDIELLRKAGIANINVDLIAGLPHQTVQSWDFSLTEAMATGVPHVSVYMLEVDNDSRLGRELLAGGERYHAHFVPDEDATADFYVKACGQLEKAGIAQYEISNFALHGFESRHNFKYWTRQPYLGFGVDAHSMLHSCSCAVEAFRFSTSDTLDRYMSGEGLHSNAISRDQALEEEFFLGLRLNRGVNLAELSAKFGEKKAGSFSASIDDLVENGLVERQDTRIRLTARGRLLSNEVFERFLAEPEIVA